MTESIRADGQNFTNEEKLKCLDREVAFRCNVYPKLIRRGQMTVEKADREVAVMRAIAADYHRATLQRQDKPECAKLV